MRIALKPRYSNVVWMFRLRVYLMSLLEPLLSDVLLRVDVQSVYFNLCLKISLELMSITVVLISMCTCPCKFTYGWYPQLLHEDLYDDFARG